MKFKDLNNNQVFEFTAAVEYGLTRGPWRKISSRKYIYAYQDELTRAMDFSHANEVGSIHAEVFIVNGEK